MARRGYRWKCQKCGVEWTKATSGKPRICPACRDRGTWSYRGVDSLVEYKIVTASEYEELEQRVNAMAKEGWKPQGGMAVLHHRWTNDHKGYDESEIIYYQAMTKEVGGST